MRVRVLIATVLIALLAPASGHALPPTWERGLNVTAYWWQDLTGKRFNQWIKRARDDERARWVTFVFPIYQDGLQSTQLRTSPGSARDCNHTDGRSTLKCKTPSDAAIRSAVRHARALGLHVILRPQVEVGTSSDNAQPRDLINVGDEHDNEWFGSYKAFVFRYLAIAAGTGVEKFVIGAGLSAMTDTETDRNAWRSLIAEARGRYNGKLTYAAQWDSIVEDAKDPATHPFFWDALDEIGIDAYFPLVGGSAPPAPSLQLLRQGWTTDPTGMGASPVQLIRNLHGEYGKPVRFTALGYLSRGGTAAFPEKSDGEQAKAGGKVNLYAQSRPIRAAFDVWSPISLEGWFRGISWWEWPASGRGGGKDGSFSLQGKPGATEVCRGHAAKRNAYCPFHQP